MIQKIDQLKQRLDTLRPLPPNKAAALASIFHARQTEYIYESNSIEGNTLTLAETELVLSQGLTVSGKPLKDHLEAINHLKAMDRLKHLADRQLPLDETSLLDLHSLILRGISDQYAGRYRDVPVRIAGSRHIPPNAIKVPELMGRMFTWFHGPGQTEHVVHAAADLHLRISQVHPFVDGNGRVCRLAMNLHLLQRGYPLTTIRSEHNQRVDYYHALAESDSTDNPEAFREFIELRVLESLERYLQVMEEAR